jgi:cytochrome b6-f complex iron-sulfur subunit
LNSFPSSEKSLVPEDETVAGLRTRCHDYEKYGSALFCITHHLHFVPITSPTVVMTDKKKLTTAEILALARKDKNAGGGSAEAEKPAETAPTESSTPQAKAAPKSTADILAAARAQAGAKKEASGESAKPAAKPKSTADILAAARAQGGGATKAAPAASKAVAKPAAKKVEAPVGDRPALKDMVAAVKESQATGAPIKPKLPVGRKPPVKPKLPKKAEKVGRRGFVALLAAIAITPFVLAWSSVTAILGIWSLGIARFMMPNMVLELPSKFKVGSPADFPPGGVSAKFKASRGVWIINSDEYNGKGIIYALASVCTHLGCTPNWLEGEQKFKCPCHGSGFYVTGVNFEGPAPRPLERVGIRLAEDGMLEVDKGVKFQEELGQWSDGKSFVDA